MGKLDKRQISIYLDEKVIEDVTDLATENKRSFSFMTNILLEEAIKKRGKKK